MSGRGRQLGLREPSGSENEFITIGVLDDDDPPEGVHDDGTQITEIFSRLSRRQLIDLEPRDAVRLARPGAAALIAIQGFQHRPRMSDDWRGPPLALTDFR